MEQIAAMEKSLLEKKQQNEQLRRKRVRKQITNFAFIEDLMAGLGILPYFRPSLITNS
jgi:hypothetical protein